MFGSLDTQSSIVALLTPLRRFVQRWITLGVVIGVAALVLYMTTGGLGVPILLVLGLGLTVAAHMWSRQSNAGLPVVVIMAAQVALIYGLPVVTQPDLLTSFGSLDPTGPVALEMGAFLTALITGWRLLARRPARHPLNYIGFRFGAYSANSLLRHLPILLLLVSLVFQLSLAEGWVNLIFRFIPFTFFPVLRSLMDVVTMIAVLLGGFKIGRKQLRAGEQFCFWLLFVVLGLMTVSGFLLSSMTGIAVGLLFGLAIGSGRFPLITFFILFLALAFLNLGKFDMREKYWDEGQAASFRVAEMPALYTEWVNVSTDNMLARTSLDPAIRDSGQSLLERINNLQNIVFVWNAVEQEERTLLLGETYTIIPQLLIPRFLWPDKPRTHEGQVLLNVHFGRQAEADTWRTYIAWGLLPEAYGNFGPIAGAIFLGLLLGAISGFIEHRSRCYPIYSLPILVLILVTVKLGVSFEMVASVLVTSTFQSLVITLLGAIPFVTRQPNQLVARRHGTGRQGSRLIRHE